MKKTAHLLTDSRTSISTSDLDAQSRCWLLDSEIRQHSQATIDNRRLILDKLAWFLRDHELAECGSRELRLFLAYVGRPQREGSGRWGNERRREPVRPITVKSYHALLRTFFAWLVSEGAIDLSPMETIAQPIARPDQVQPFSEAQIAALLKAAKATHHPKRDELIIRLLFDTGVRASELVALKMKNIDIGERRCLVKGKGNKHRSVYFGRNAAKALWQYLRESPREPDEPLFASDRGKTSGDALTRSGLLQLIKRLAREARIEAVRASPHTLRHAFAINFIRAGGNVFTLKEILGHTSLAMVNKYVALAEADIEMQHRRYSPGDRLTARAAAK